MTNLCDATQAVAIHIYKKPPLHRRFFYALIRFGWAVPLLALVVLVLAACTGDMRYEHAAAKELLAIQHEEAAKAAREFVGQQVCGAGARAEWRDDKTLVCTPKRGKPYTVAGAKP
jgi:hypothetical protein